MDLKILYKNLLGDLEIEGNDWIKITDIENLITIKGTEEKIKCLLFFVREREALKKHLAIRNVRNYAIASIQGENPDKKYLEMFGIYFPIENEEEVHNIAESIKEFYKFM